MISKNEVKYIQSLYQKKTRNAEGLFIVQGQKLVDELLQNNFTVKKIYAAPEWIKPGTHFHDIIEVTPDELKKISSQQTPNSVLAVAVQKKPEGDPDVLSCVSLVLDGIQDPGNLGTIIRTADWFGIKQIIASHDTVDLYNEKVIQSTMGSFIRVHVWYKNLEEWLPQINVPVFGAMLKGNDVSASLKIKQGVLVIGNESQGIRAPLIPFIHHMLTVPRKGGTESLNAAVAAGIMLSHLVE